MIGVVRDNFPRLSVELPGLNEPVTIEFVLDTGFEGALSVPQSLLNRLAANPLGNRAVSLADGTRSYRPYYEMEIEWAEETRFVDVALLENTPLLGTELLQGYEVTLEMIEGGIVSLHLL